MIPEQVFHRILLLGEEWRVSAVDYVEKASQVLIRVEETPKLWQAERCPHCQGTSVKRGARSRERGPRGEPGFGLVGRREGRGTASPVGEAGEAGEETTA